VDFVQIFGKPSYGFGLFLPVLPRYRTVGVTIKPSRARARLEPGSQVPYPSGLNKRPFLGRAVLTCHPGRSQSQAESETGPLAWRGGQGEAFPGRA